MFSEDLAIWVLPAFLPQLWQTKEWNGQMCKIKETSPEMRLIGFLTKISFEEAFLEHYMSYTHKMSAIEVT